MAFFATGNRFAHAWEVSSGTLVLPDAVRREMNHDRSGRDRITGDYDRYLLCGLGFQFRRFKMLHEAFRIDGSTRDQRAPISADCFHHAVRGILRQSLSVITLSKLRAITSAPIGIVPQPCICESDLTLDRLRESKSDNIVADAYSHAAGELASELEVDLYLQPEETLSAPLQTRQVYQRQGIHMNAAYGEQVLLAVLSEISEAGGVN